MHIGKVATLTGASRKAIRMYEEMGLMPAPERHGNYRIYTPHHVTIVDMIKRAQAVGFKLSELSAFMEAKAEYDAFPLELALNLIDEKRATFKLEIARLKQLDKQLLQLKADIPFLAAG